MLGPEPPDEGPHRAVAPEHDVRTVVEPAAALPIDERERTPAEPTARLEQRDIESPIGQTQRRRQAGDAAADDDRTPTHARTPVKISSASQSLTGRGTRARSASSRPPRAASRRSRLR